MSNNITIKDGNNANVTLHTIEDATSTHFNQSIPTDIANNTATVVSGGQAVASGMGALVVAQRDALPAGTNHLGKVSVTGSVSIQQTGGLFVQAQGIYMATPPTLVDATVSTLQTDSRGSLRVTLVVPDSNGGIGKTSSFTDGNVNNANRVTAETYPMVYNAASNTWDRATGTSVGQNVVIQNTNNIAVSAGSIGFPNSDGLGLGTVAHLRSMTAPHVFNAASGTWDRITGSSVGINTVGKARYNATAPTHADATVSVLQMGSRGALHTQIQGGDSAITWGFGADNADGVAAVGSGIPKVGSHTKIWNTAGSTWDRWDGKVSIGNTVPVPVSITNTLDVDVSVGTHPVTQSGTWNVNVAGAIVSNPNTATITAANGALYTAALTYGWDGTNWRRVDIDTNGKANVSISNTLNIGVSIAAGRVSTAGLVSVWDANTVVPDTDAKVWQGFQNSIAVATNYVFNRNSNTWDRMTGTSVGLAVVGTVSITGPLPAGTNHLGKVSVEGLSISGVGTQLVSVGGPVSVQGVQIVGRDGSGNARTPYIDASGIARVSIEGALTVTGGSMTHTVGTAVTTEGYPMLGSDGTNSRRLLTTTGGALVVHVSNTAPGGAAVGSTQLVSVAGPVSTQGVQVVGTDGAGNARTLLTDTTGRIAIASIGQKVAVSVNGGQIVGQNSVDGQGTQQGMFVHNQGSVFNRNSNTWDRMTGTSVGLAVIQGGTWNVGLNAGTNLVGAVSISPNGLNIPVSIAPLTFNLPVSVHPVTQSGAWNINAITSINSRVAVSVENVNNIAVSVAPPTFNIPVSIAGTPTVGLAAGTNLIGAVSISPNGLNIPVSIAAGRVSVNGIVTIAPAANFSAALPAHGMPIGGEVSTANGTFSSGVLAPLQLDTNGRLKISGTITGGSMTQTVGAAVTTEGYPMLGSDGTNARRLLTTTGGALVVHVSNTAPGGSTGGTVMVSVGGAVSTQAVQIAGVDPSGNARTIETNVSGVQVITTRTFMSQVTFTRPNDTTAYAAGATAAPGNAGDLIANDTTNTLVKPLKFRVARGPGQVSYIRGARMFRTGGGLAAGQHNITGAIRLHLFNTNNKVSVANGDNGAFNASPVSNWMGYIDLVAIACAPGLRTSGAVSTQVYWGSPARTGEMIVDLSAAQVSIQGLLETRIAFTPIAQEIFTVQIEGFNG